MIGAIEGGDLLEERLRSARETAKRPVGGFLLDGFQGTTMTQETKLNLLKSVTAELPEDKPRFVLSYLLPIFLIKWTLSKTDILAFRSWQV